MARHGRITIAAPLVLAIENASQYGSVAVVGDGGCLAESSLVSGETHSKRLLLSIDRLLADTGLDWPGLAAIAVSIGPGSFTGIRIGLATAKGLAMAAGKPLLGISTLDGLARQLAVQPLPVRPVLDARKKELFTACYRLDASGRQQRMEEYRVLAPEKLAAEICEPTLLVGDGLSVYGALFRERLGENCRTAPAELFFPRAAAIGVLAVERITGGDHPGASDVLPLYVRASDAELSLGRR
ncbi:MAG: tRNA (adenosine(37)-N6)-threonylcarbamoyltransferase complex dimerization subunit type 1 TsaB [Thermodesulfobacteriota bacterium]